MAKREEIIDKYITKINADLKRKEDQINRILRNARHLKETEGGRIQIGPSGEYEHSFKEMGGRILRTKGMTREKYEFNLIDNIDNSKKMIGVYIGELEGFNTGKYTDNKYEGRLSYSGTSIKSYKEYIKREEKELEASMNALKESLATPYSDRETTSSAEGYIQKLKTLEKLKEERGKRNNAKDSGLEKTAAAASIVGILGGLFFLSSNITGNAIANVSRSSGNILGAVLLVVGLVASFFWVKKK